MQKVKPNTPVYFKRLFAESIDHIKDEKLKDTLYSPKHLQRAEELFISIMMDLKVSPYILALKEWDEFSYYHSFHVFYLGSYFAKKMNLEHYELFSLGCFLHDIGKLFVPREILRKNGKLTIKEFSKIKEHTILGERWLNEHFLYNKVYLSKLIRMHHERLDGSGYPDRLRGQSIPFEVRLLTIIDVFSALTLNRAYRESLAPLSAIEVLLSEKEKYDYSILQQLIDGLNLLPNHAIDLLSQVSKQRKELAWDRYINSLLHGNKVGALEMFDVLSDGMRIEDIYMDIISKSIQTIEELWKSLKINTVEKHIACSITREILDVKLVEYYCRQEMKGKILLTSVRNEQDTLLLKMVADALTLNGWKVFSLECNVPFVDLVQFIEKHQIQYVGCLISKRENMPFLQRLVNRLKSSFSEILIVAGGQAVVQQEEELEVDHIVQNVQDAVQFFEKYRVT